MAETTTTYADALRRINVWRKANACTPLTTLPDLSTHCERCGFPYTEKDLGGGRCLDCEASIGSPPIVTDRPPEAAEPTDDGWCIVQYGRRHGYDAWIVRRDDSLHSIVNVILDSIEDAGDDQRAVLDAILAGDLGEAVRLWTEATGEWFDSRDVKLPTGRERDPIDQAREALAALDEQESLSGQEDAP
jgi:hypothetical protein